MSIDLLFRYYYRPLCLYAIHYMKDVDQAEDIVQDSFVRMMERLHSEKQVDNAKSYLYAMVRNACIDRLHQQSPIDTSIVPQDLDGEIADEEAAERSLHEAELWTAIDALPARCREVFLLSKRDQLKYHEIASRLGISVKTVENQMSKALKTLRGKVDDFFYMLLALS